VWFSLLLQGWNVPWPVGELFLIVVSAAGSTVDVSAQSRNCTRLPVTSSTQVNWGWLSKFPVPRAAGSEQENISDLPEQRRR